MRTTLDIHDRLLTEAQRLSESRAKTAIQHTGLESLIARESAALEADSPTPTSTPELVLVDTSVWVDDEAIRRHRAQARSLTDEHPRILAPGPREERRPCA